MPELAAVVKKITVITEDDPHAGITAVTYFADGLPGLMFHHSDNGIVLANEEHKLSSLFLYGQTVKPVRISTSGHYTTIIFHFFPYVIKPWFGIDADELTDSCMDATVLRCREIAELKEELPRSINTQHQVNLISRALRKIVARTGTLPSTDIRMAVERISSTPDAVRLCDLHRELHVCERTFERKFLQYVGVTPSLFRRICKFYSSLRELESDRFSNLTKLSYDQGFADQSHFIRTFKQFTGFSPREYLLSFSRENTPQ